MPTDWFPPHWIASAEILRYQAGILNERFHLKAFANDVGDLETKLLAVQASPKP